MQHPIVNPYIKYDYNRMKKDINKLKRRFSFLSNFTIGTTHEGRDIELVVLGAGEKKIFIVGAHHGREYITSAYLMREIEFLCELGARKRIMQGMDINMLLQEVQLYFVPMLNPDGVNISIFGKNAAQYPERIGKMRLIGPGYETWKANANGVDLNRSYPCLFEQKSTLVASPASELYKGAVPGGESEVRAVMDLCERENFCLAATFHAKGEEVYWADRNSENEIEGAKELAQAVGQISGYKVMPPSTDPGKYAAGFENWFRSRFKKICLLIELSPFTDSYIPHTMKNFDALVWNNAKYIIPVMMNHI